MRHHGELPSLQTSDVCGSFAPAAASASGTAVSVSIFQPSSVRIVKRGVYPLLNKREVMRESGRSTDAGNFRISTGFVGVLTDVVELRYHVTPRFCFGGVKSFTLRSVASSVVWSMPTPMYPVSSVNSRRSTSTTGDTAARTTERLSRKIGTV